MLTGAGPSSSRRGLLTGAVAGAASLTGCSDPPAEVPGTSVARSSYGADASQHGELYLPDGAPEATVVVLHGGFWLAEYRADATRPMSEALRAEGFAVWNLEYRRLDAGGGWPATFRDVAAGIDHLATVDGVDTADVRLVGHSAGGQLAVWAASRRGRTPGGRSAVTVTRCVSLAGVLDLSTAATSGLGSGNVDRLMGGSPTLVPQHYRDGDPALLVPAGCPVACVVARDDQTVPRTQATAYVAAARGAGAAVSLDEVPGDHFAVIDPTSAPWATVLRLLRG